MCEIQDGLGHVRRLDDAADLDGAFIFNELANHEQKFRRELRKLVDAKEISD